MLRALPPTATNHHPDHDWNCAAPSVEHVIPFGCLIHDLFEAQQREIYALMREYGTHSAEGRADDQPRQGVLGERRVHDPLFAEFSDQSASGPENAFRIRHTEAD